MGRARGAGGGVTRVLLAGELAYNPERILALAPHGVAFCGGLWIDDPLPFMTVGPLPFLPGLPDVGLDDWPATRPDVIYAGLNWRCIPLVEALLPQARRLGVPVVLHFKEAPQRCRARGEWARFAAVHEGVDVRVYASATEAAHVEALLPGRADPAATHVLDGDLPPAARFAGADEPWGRREEPHTVLVGRPYGMDADWLRGVTRAGTHVHVHAHEAPDWPADPRLHVHGPVAPADWGRVLSGYDASWLHPVRSANGGDPAAATWDDCNLPARLATSFAAGLPVIARANPGHRVEVQDVVVRSGAGVLHEDAETLAAWLASPALDAARRAVAEERERWCFDPHAPWLAGVLHRAGGS
ncbi:MAG: hypothetical protein JWO90_1041 [Solirubrobacterales bacterium]|nr:hypothetical protein [Solirubrobacterales bacterium]